MTAILIWGLLAGCSTLRTTATTEARCTFRVAAPHEIRCVVDGREVYRQTGPMALDVEGCCRCPTPTP